MRPGWLVALCAAVLAVSAWLPWLTTGAGGRANAVGGAVGGAPTPPGFGAGQLIVLLASALIVVGAMAGRGLGGRLASVAALTISVALVALTWWYYSQNISSTVSAGYGLYVGGAFAVVAAACSVWAMVGAVSSPRSR